MTSLPDRQLIETTTSIAGASIFRPRESAKVRATRGGSRGPLFGKVGVVTDVTMRGEYTHGG